MENLEIQLCRVSPLGARVPIARSANQALVREVGERILAEMRAWRLADPLLAELAKEEAGRLARTLGEKLQEVKQYA